jgi:hypothetical protein
VGTVLCGGRHLTLTACASHSHFGNDFSVTFLASLSATLKARKIDDTDTDEVGPAKAAVPDRRLSLFRRLSAKELAPAPAVAGKA